MVPVRTALASRFSPCVAAATLAGAIGGALACAAFALLAISFRANFIIVGIGINLVVAGLTATATAALFGTAGTISTPELRPLANWSIPGLDAVPWIGNVVSGQTLLTYLSWVIAPLFAWWLANTPAGLTVRMTGSRPDIADAMKRPVAANPFGACARQDRRLMPAPRTATFMLPSIRSGSPGR
ncbi:ABC transporter permease subunit [Phyllobacterium zundukense]|uniref:ABC transporter permease subunit n=1 Tax=Phyllobacterium zundukense TaxID=1867719 RepID=UPI0039658DF7